MTVNPIWNKLWQQPKPHFKKGDTSAASARIVELRRKESLPVPRELVAAPEALEARWRSKYPDEHIPVGEVLPWQPAKPGARPRKVRTVRLLPEDGCQFPIGEPGAAGFKFCDAPRSSASYCISHNAMVHRATPRLRIVVPS